METHESKGYLKLQLDPSSHLYPSPLLYYPPAHGSLTSFAFVFALCLASSTRCPGAQRLCLVHSCISDAYPSVLHTVGTHLTLLIGLRKARLPGRQWR